jgi:anthranilate synthase component 2
MILMIDNYDSFTYNVVQYCLELGANLEVIRNDELTLTQIKELNPQKIIISPGPATPNEAGVTLEVIKEFADTTPIFGICLGHQSIAQAFGAEVIRAKNMMHGKTSQVEIDVDTIVFDGLPKEFRATRYHSLSVNKENLLQNKEFIISGGMKPLSGYYLMQNLNAPAIMGMAFQFLKYAREDYSQLQKYTALVQKTLQIAQSFLYIK